MKTIFKFLFSIVLVLSMASCSDFLDRDPNNIITNDDIYKDPNMVNSVLANFYGRINTGDNDNNGKNKSWKQQSIAFDDQYIFLDEACASSGGPDNTKDYGDDKWRIYDYVLIHDINVFIQGIRSNAAASLDPTYRKQAEGEARFVRAWAYFSMAKCLGGISILGDTVFSYTPGMDMTSLQIPRSTEAATYDYVISECSVIANMLPIEPSKNVNAAHANKWGALALKSRAAIYAGSLAKYNNLMQNPIRTAGGEVGIPADKANGYYQIALAACKEIIDSKKYSLYNSNPNKGKNFYEAIAKKQGNPEVIWAVDYAYPGQTTGFTTGNTPTSVQEDIDANNRTPVLNLVEAFEFIDRRDGTLQTKKPNGEYVYYDNASDIFKDKDPRLYGTVIYPGSDFRSQEIAFQAGRKKWDNGQWVNETAKPGTVDVNGKTITSINGPVINNEQYQNKAGFCIRKFLDETPGSGTRGKGSEMWFIRFRYAEVLMTAAEAAMELGNQGEALTYINEIRDRAGIQPLTSLNVHDIIHERRVEFAFEDHRWWDLKRFRQAHLIWNGVAGNQTATQYVLFPYVIYNPGQPNDGKWVFDKIEAFMAPYPRYFQLKNYYNFYDAEWLSKNPALVKNPYQ